MNSYLIQYWLPNFNYEFLLDALAKIITDIAVQVGLLVRYSITDLRNYHGYLAY